MIVESSRRENLVSISLEQLVPCMKHSLSREAVRTREASSFDVTSIKFFAIPSVAGYSLFWDTWAWVGDSGMIESHFTHVRI